ncbi:MAG: hydroxyphenylacetyl-CoA thioesterase PaaI [Saprospiraceae bacterium]|nr:hydroxyphenylacetyl-CoA thioesterase PaaI [Saprospiraceae bacterium]
MESLLTPTEIIDKMYFNDPFSLWLGIERIEESLGYSKIKMTVRKEMLNGFHIAHGGITFSLADSAFAFASNSHGRHAVSIECSINHLHPVKEHDTLIAEAKQLSIKRTHAVYMVEVKNQAEELVALFRGMVYIKDTHWK